MTATPIRLLTVLPLALAPAVMGAALLTDITPQAGDTQELLELIAQDPGAWSMGQTLFFISALLWVPAGLLLMRLFGREQRLGRAAGAAVAVGGLAVLAVDAAGLYLRELATSDIPINQQVQLFEGVESSPTVLLFETVHIAGLFLGLLVVGVAMLRHTALPRAAGTLVLTGTIALVVAPAGPMLAAAAALLVAGFVITALRISRQARYGLTKHPHARDSTATTEDRMRSGSDQPIER